MTGLNRMGLSSYFHLRIDQNQLYYSANIYQTHLNNNTMKGRRHVRPLLEATCLSKDDKFYLSPPSTVSRPRGQGTGDPPFLPQIPCLADDCQSPTSVAAAGRPTWGSTFQAGSEGQAS